MNAKGNGVAGTYDCRGKNCHEPDQCPEQFWADIFSSGISTGDQKTKPHHCKQEDREGKDRSGFVTPAVRDITGGKMGRNLNRKLIPQKQSDQYRT